MSCWTFLGNCREHLRIVRGRHVQQKSRRSFVHVVSCRLFSTPSRPTLGAGGVTQILGDLVSKTRGGACQPLEDDGVAAHSTHPPTYRWEPDGVVDLLGTMAPPHTTRFAA